MPKHIYMSVGRWDGARFVNPRTGHATVMMRYRGEVGPNDNPTRFQQMMQQRGHVVWIEDRRLLEEENGRGEIEVPHLSPNR